MQPRSLTNLAGAVFLALVILPQLSVAQTTIEVNTATDVAAAGDGLCSLQEAIVAANSNSPSGGVAGECDGGSAIATDTISFNIGGGLTQIIAPAGALPTITSDVYIDGFRQGCASGPCIALDGTAAGIGQNGLQVTAGGSGSTIRGLAIFNFSSSAILLNGPSGVTVEGNYLGTNLAGNAAAANNIGVAVTGGASGNQIGGTTEETRNVVSGNGNGGVDIWGVGTTGNVVSGNYVGTDATGTAAIPNGTAGVTIRNESSDNQVGGTAPGSGNLLSGNGRSGVELQDSVANNRIEGNLIGTDATGTASIPNREGIFLAQGANRNIIGGSASGARNVISGNQDEGVHIQGSSSDSNRVEGNFIGTDVAGTAALTNGGNGVEILLEASDNIIGGPSTAERNIISGNTSFGVVVRDSASTGNRIIGNYIGTDLTGTAALANGSYGVTLSFETTGNYVGGPSGNEGNLISGNNLGGVQITNAGTSGNVIQGNLIGTDMSGSAPLPNGEGIRFFIGADSNLVGGTVLGTGNTIAFNTFDGVVMGANAGPMNAVLGNSIFSNGSGGIDLGDDGTTANDAGDPDPGPNRLQNTPVIQPSPVIDPNTGQLAVTYLVDSNPANADYPIRVEFFLADADMQEGMTFIGFDEYTASDFASGNKSISFTPSAPVAENDQVLATATDSLGNTSEFSADQTVLPVELASFSGLVDGERVILTWETASETNNAGFTVQMRSHQTWIGLDFVEGAGTTSDPQNYRFETERLEPGAYGFRLKQVDFDGSFEYSSVVELVVEVPRVLELHNSYPNPFNPSTNLTFTVPADGRASLIVYNSVGQEVATLFDDQAKTGQVHRVTFDGRGLAAGSYIATLRFGGVQKSTTLVFAP